MVTFCYCVEQKVEYYLLLHGNCMMLRQLKVILNLIWSNHGLSNRFLLDEGISKYFENSKRKTQVL